MQAALAVYHRLTKFIALAIYYGSDDLRNRSACLYPQIKFGFGCQLGEKIRELHVQRDPGARLVRADLLRTAQSFNIPCFSSMSATQSSPSS